MENRKTVVLQSHMDMVGEKNANYPHNWTTDPIIPAIKNGWVTANRNYFWAQMMESALHHNWQILTDENLVAGKN